MKRTTDRKSIRQSHARLPRLQPQPRRVSPMNRCSFCGTEVCQCRQRVGVTPAGVAYLNDLRLVRDNHDETGVSDR